MDTETATGLSKADITALRTADDVYVNVYEGVCTLTAKKRRPYGTDDPWAEDKRHDIVVEFSLLAYGQHGGTDFDLTASITTCYASLWHCEGIWQIVRPGDRLKLRFSANNNSDNLRAVGYVRDGVEIEVIRKADTDGRKPLRFPAADYVGPNNSARFVRSSAYGL